MAEQRQHRIIEKVSTFLLDANLLGQFCVDAAYVATYVINHLPTPLLDNYSPFEKLFHKVPDYSFLCVFGCKCFPTLLTQPHQLRSKKCVFIGYASHNKGYQCLQVDSMSVVMCCFVRMSSYIPTFKISCLCSTTSLP